jgi:SGNH hydrolase-like domain, acetyltransferase AlgX
VAAKANMEATMVRVSNGLHIKLASLTPIFEAAAKEGKFLYYPFDTHWNSTGREIAAAFVASILRKETELRPRHPDI